MAKSNIEINVSIEETITDQLRKIAEEINNKHGIIINSVVIDWRDDSEVGKVVHNVNEIDVDIKSVYR